MVTRAIGGIAFGETGRKAETGWIEEGMSFVDPCVDIANFDAGSCSRPSPSSSPSGSCIDDLMAFTQNRMVECIVLDRLYHWRAFDRLHRCPVKLDGDGVERNIVDRKSTRLNSSHRTSSY